MTESPQGSEQLELLRRFEPILRFTAGELFLPASAEDYVRRCELLERGPDGKRTLLVGKGDLTVDRLAESGLDHPRPGQFLRFVAEPLGRTEVARWRLRASRPRFHNASRLARVGVLSRGIDAVSRASLMVRGKVVSGTEAAAETQYRTTMRPEHHPYYGRILHDGGYTVLQYWYFYVFNDWRSRVYGVNDHEADWEQVTIYLVEGDDGYRPAWIVSSAHDEVGDDLRRRWDDPDLTLIGEHPVIHPGLGSHSGAYVAGEYLTSYEGPAFSRLRRWTRKVSHTLLPWTREHAHSGLSIPYIDYSRGDGVGVGPGEERTWEPVLIDEATSWVVGYRGLWGNDTHDPLGGERGPAGPRYERSGTVRMSWGDPVGWAGLRKVPPSPRAGNDALAERLSELDDEITELSGRIETHEMRLRAVTSMGDVVSVSAEDELATLSAERVARRDERLLLAHGVDRPPPASAPHDHLRHRRLPLPPEARVRRRLLAIWSAVTVPCLLGVVIGMLLRPGWTAASIGVEAIVVLFALEALARRQFVRFAALVAVALVVAWIVLAVAAALVNDWRIAVAIPLGLTALALLVINLKELLRD